MWDLWRGAWVWILNEGGSKEALILFNIIHMLENHSRRRLFEDLHPACFKKMTTEPQYSKFIIYWLGCPVGKIAPKPSNAIFHVWCRICLKNDYFQDCSIHWRRKILGLLHSFSQKFGKASKSFPPLTDAQQAWLLVLQWRTIFLTDLN